MKTIIIYSSTYKGNTKKIAQAMGEEISAELLDVDEAENIDLSKYDLIGLGAGINFAQHDIRLIQFVDQQSFKGLNVFIFSTKCRPFLGGYHSSIKTALKGRGANILGEFSCAGFDRTGPWVISDGYNKNRPNNKDMFKARLFASKMRRAAHPLVETIAQPLSDSCFELPARLCQNSNIVGKIVMFNTSTCVQCGKCLDLCPMNVYEIKKHENRDVILPVNEQNCIQCGKCEPFCPTDSIYINESFTNGLRIVMWEIFTEKLQTGYKKIKKVGSEISNL